MAYARKVDRNQAEIVDALRQVGASVFSLHRVGHGCPDILVGYRGTSYLMEVKSDNGKLNDNEREWIANWRGMDVAVVRTVDEALETIGAM